MHRRGLEDDDLLVAISPPPEFQDLPAPPPTVFRDTSPSPCTKSQAHHQRLCDFAARISFNIVNEAMVIATEEVVSNVSYPTTRTVSSHVHHTSGFSEEEETSITTSWEYLPKPTSTKTTDAVVRLRGLRPPPDNQILLPIKVNRSASFHLQELSDGGCCTTSSRVNLRKSINIPHQCNDNARSNEGPKQTTNRHSIAETSNTMKSAVLNENRKVGHNASETKEKDLGENDIYSLPVDDISTRLGPDNGLAYNRQTRNNDCNTSRSRQRQNSISKLQNCDTIQLSQGNALDSVKTSICLEDHDKSTGLLDYLPSHSANGGNKLRNQTARRSQSVEVNISSVGATFHMDASRLNYQDRGQCERNASTKQEKRTIGNSILNLFKRKSRSKARLNENESFSSGSTSRALPPPPPPPAVVASDSESEMEPMVRISDSQGNSFSDPLDLGPWSDEESTDDAPVAKDFTVSIEKVKDQGYYWGPLSSEEAEDLLRLEPEGSFLIRDSSDAHYIFSLTFKLKTSIKHVRIEQSQGNFSFGPLTRFKAATIVDFVEKAVAHSRSGRYLFFLHRRPVLGPMRVQLLHPYSRFRHSRSLQHMCRFVILKYVRRDLISSLPLPTPLQEYLNTPHYYFEKYEDRKPS